MAGQWHVLWTHDGLPVETTVTQGESGHEGETHREAKLRFDAAVEAKETNPLTAPN